MQAVSRGPMRLLGIGMLGIKNVGRRASIEEEKDGNDMRKIEKAFLEIIIREVKECMNQTGINKPITNFQALERIEKLLQTWIDANDLHPERVVVSNGIHARQIG